MKRKFFDTEFVKYTGMDINVDRMLKYVVMNQGTVYDSDDLTALAQQIRTILKTPMSELFDRVVARGALANFAAINVSAKDTSIPELLTMPNITVDLGHLPVSTAPLASIPKLNNKILINLTGVTKSTPYSNELTVTNVDILQNLIVRGQLVAGFHDDKSDWIVSNTNMLLFVLKSYSMILATDIARYYNLDLDAMQRIATILTLYMDYACGSPVGRPSTMSRWDWCSDMSIRHMIVDSCSEYVDGNGNFTLSGACSSLANLISNRMEKFSLDTMLAFSGRLGPDVITSRIALEYPPYWVYLLILALNGNKIPLAYKLARERTILREGTTFLNNAYSSGALFAIR